ncbi:MAG: nicotinate-nicotinamide nucleotide adenylyltransferase, partial [Thermoleophilia bacterium]|nr:nicotinate-nicotinamide nucleotide adenylyltransferase [Thermoleophilia bacterium]
MLGSAFNPPHLGHMVLAGEAKWRLGLAEVLLVPTGDSYHKDVSVDPGGRARLALTEAAIQGQEGLSVWSIEIERPGPSYTCDTLERIAELRPDSEVHLLMGADTALGFGDWHEPEGILDLARIGIAPRQGCREADVETAFEGLGGADRIEFIEMPPVGISST